MMPVSMDYTKRQEEYEAQNDPIWPYFISSRYLILNNRGHEVLGYEEQLRHQVPHAKIQSAESDEDGLRHTHRDRGYTNVSEVVEAWSEYVYVRNLEGLLELTKDGEAIVFVTVEDAVANNRTTMKLGKYLRKVLPNYPDEWYAKRVLETKAILDINEERYKVHFSEDAHEAEWAYGNGPNSCMKYVASDIHPARVYCVDLKVAYIMSLDKQKCIARCVVYPDQMLMACVYGNRVLEDKLEDMGYSSGSGWEGARLKRIEDSEDRIICPYLDTYETYVEDYGGYLVISNDGHVCADQTTGYLHTTLEECDCCGYEYEEDELCRVSGGDHVCISCIDTDYRLVSSTDEYHRESEVYWCEEEEEYVLC